MKVTIEAKESSSKIIKKCHVCGHLMESKKEIEKCDSCHKPFLPMNYFGKVHAKSSTEFKQLFSKASELHEDEMIRGLTVLW